MQKDEIRERLMELLQSVPNSEMIIGKRAGKRYATAWHIANHLVENGVTIQRWIPVSEQLPTEADEDVSECVLAIERQDGFTRRWAGRSVRNCPELFTYWMPLPQTPKEDDDD